MTNEVYVAPSGVAKHMELAGSWAGFAKFGEYLKEFAKLISAGSNSVCCSLTDEATTVTPALGNPGLHFSLSVPADDVAEVEAWVMDHETWLRKTHTLTNGGEGTSCDKCPRLDSYNFSKGPE